MTMMSAILLKNVPPGLHRRLKTRAVAERRSLQQEVMLVLEHGLSALDGAQHNYLPPPTPLKMRVPLTNAFLAEIKRERDARR
jgi:plasmid stability protein